MENSSGMLRQQAEQLIARDDYGSLEIALSLLKLPDATSKSHAETLFNYCKNHYAPTLCVKLAYILRSSQLVKTRIQSQLDTNIKAQLKAILIESFLKETNREVAEGLRKLISAIALKFLPRNVWPELIDSIFLSLRPNFTPTLNVIQESALLLFAELSPQLGEIGTNRIDELYNACPPNVKAAAVKALVYLVAFLVDSSSFSRFPDLLNTMGFAAFTLIGQNEYAHGVLEDLIMLVGSKPSFFFCVALKMFGYMSVTKWKGIRTEKNFKAELLTGAREFSYRELKSATRGFHSSRIVGYGAFVKRSRHTHEDYPIRFLDSSTNSTASFSCRFSFSIVPSSPSCPFGEDIAFLITSNAGFFSPAVGHMGLSDLSLNGQDSFVAVEFDTSVDPTLGDINGNHIGIDVNTVVSFASVDAISKGVDLKSGKQITAWIEYRDSAKMIMVWIGYSTTRPSSSLLVAHIDLSKQFKKFMHVGFSASNGEVFAIHTVDRWRFKTFETLPWASPMETIEEGDCLMCSPDEPGINGSPLNFHTKKTKFGELTLGLGVLAALLVFVIAILVISGFHIMKKRRSLNGGRNKEGQTCRIQTTGGAGKIVTS